MRLYEFLSGAASRPYRDLIRFHIRRQAKHELQAGCVSEISLLPDGLIPLAESFIDRLNEWLLRDRAFWQTASCQDAVNSVVGIANDHFGLALPIPADPQVISGVEQELIFGLFQVATLSFAYSAIDQKGLRKFIGIRKGLLA